VNVSALGMRRHRRSVTDAISVIEKTQRSDAAAGGSHMAQPYRKTVARPQPQTSSNFVGSLTIVVCNRDAALAR
jgi:hypothetical protein